ncbi:MAG TPA: hypothetical protein VNL77_14385 [Roseiflexaceae bacterium]|nr:hypothetical protein [Roseiflexaceae bacterium]
MSILLLIAAAALLAALAAALPVRPAPARVPVRATHQRRTRSAKR